MKRIFIPLFLAIILSSCGHKVYLSAEEKLYLHYEIGDTLKLLNQSKSDTIMLIAKSKGTNMKSGCGNETVHEYGFNYLEMDSSYCSIRADSYLNIELKTRKTYIYDSYKFSKILDSVEMNSVLYKNVNYLKGYYSNLYFSFEKGILKITDLQDSALVEIRP